MMILFVTEHKNELRYFPLLLSQHSLTYVWLVMHSTFVSAIPDPKQDFRLNLMVHDGVKPR